MKKIRNLKALIVWLLVNASFGFGQDAADSLKEVYHQATDNQAQLKALEGLQDFYKYKNPDSAVFYADLAISLSTSVGDTMLWAHALNNKSALLIGKGKLDSAGLLLNHALKLLVTQKDQVELGKVYINLGNVAVYQQAFDQALSYYLKSLSFLDSIQYPSDYSRVNNNMAIIHARLKEFDKARAYFEKALSIHKKQDGLTLQVLTNLAGIYEELDMPSQAFQHYFMAEKMAKDLGQKRVLGILYTNLSNMYIKSGDWKKALGYGQKGLVISKELGAQPSVIALNNVGYAHFKLGNTQEAIRNYEKAMPASDGIFKQQLLLNLKSAWIQAGNNAEALKYFQEYDKLKDSLSELAYQEKVKEIGEKYESEKKQREINSLSVENELQKTKLNQQQYLIVAGILMVAMMVGFSYLGFKNYKTKEALSKTLLQQRFLRMQLNPHFIFHALNSVQNFFYKNDSKKSMQYLHSFSRLIRQILEVSDQDEVAVEEEVEMLKNYLTIQQLNNNGSFEYEVNLDPDILGKDYTIPPMLTQPFVENAVVHGIVGREGALVKVDVFKENGHLNIAISDNGRGVDVGNTDFGERKLHRSMSRSIIDQRIKNFNSNNKAKMEVKLSNAYDESDFPGTKVLLTVPVQRE